MKGYGQICPVARSAALLSERWTALVLRELLAGSRHFNDIHRGVPRMSRTLLSRRLSDLAQAGIVEKLSDGRHEGYFLTVAGRELRPVIEYMARWATRWRNDDEPDRADPAFIMWEIRRGVRVNALPDRPLTFIFEFTDVRRSGRYWTLSRSGDALTMQRVSSIGNADLLVRAECRTLSLVWFGQSSLTEAIDRGQLELEGDPALARGMSAWLGRSPYAAEEF